jgi:hypothetical protein
VEVELWKDNKKTGIILVSIFLKIFWWMINDLNILLLNTE